jgi:hypothetical protein
MRLVKFTAVGGAFIWINPEAIVTMHESETEKMRTMVVSLTGGITANIEATEAQIEQAIKNAQQL